MDPWIFPLAAGGILGAALVFLYGSKDRHAAGESKIKLAALEEENRALLRELITLQSKEETLSEVKEKLYDEFADLSKELAQGQSKELSTSCSTLLTPLREELKEFKQQVTRIQSEHQSSREILANTQRALSHEISGLKTALRGDIQRQGSWGELVLQRTLELSGLREGFEYRTQSHELHTEERGGGRIIPDVIVDLPEGRHLIIDAKMPFRHYESSCTGDNEHSIKELTGALEEHIRKLSAKEYAQAKGALSPDFVLLFIPIESLFSFVMSRSPDLFEKAWRQSVILVSPSTLFATLKTVEGLWRFDRQNKNQEAIIRKAEEIYDKCRTFLDSFTKVEKHLQSAQSAYTEAAKSLSLGKGSLLSKVEKLKNYGISGKKGLKNLMEFEEDGEGEKVEQEALE